MKYIRLYVLINSSNWIYLNKTDQIKIIHDNSRDLTPWLILLSLKRFEAQTLSYQKIQYSLIRITRDSFWFHRSVVFKQKSWPDIPISKLKSSKLERTHKYEESERVACYMN